MKFISTIIIILLLDGCATSEVWRNDSYKENISQFLTTKDRSTLIVIGEKYHYVFPDSTHLNDIMLSEYRGMLSADFGNRFVVSLKNEISGKFRIVCDCTEISNEMREWLYAHNFKKITIKKECSSKEIFSRQSDIVGVRYDKGDIALDSTRNFNKSYTVLIEEEHGSAGTAGRILKTPIAVAVDGVYTYGAVALAVVLWPLTTYNIIYSVTNDVSPSDNCNKKSPNNSFNIDLGDAAHPSAS